MSRGSRFQSFMARLQQRCDARGIAIRLVDEDWARHKASMNAENVRKAAVKVIGKPGLQALAEAGLLVVAAEDWEHLGGAEALSKPCREHIDETLRTRVDAANEVEIDRERLRRKNKKLRRIVRDMAKCL